MKKMNREGPEAEIYESEHYICEDCYKEHLKTKIEMDDEDEDEEENKNGVVDFEKELILCSICCRKHLFKISGNEACCADCVIF